MRMFDVETGETVQVYERRGPCRSVAWTLSGNRFAVINDAMGGNPPTLTVYEVPAEGEPDTFPAIEVSVETKATRVAWGPNDEFIIVAFEDGSVKHFDPQTGDMLKEEQVSKEGLFGVACASNNLWRRWWPGTIS